MLQHKTLLSICCILLSAAPLCAQQVDVDNLLNYKDKYLRYGGGIYLNTVYTAGNESQVTRQPFTYVVGANLNLQLMNFSLPFTFSYTNQQFQYSQPFKFNRLAIHPKYKAITAHIGDITMNFSPYSLNGHQFTGAGLELAPARLPVKLTVLYGRFLKATEPDSLNLPAYARWGWGVKSEYSKRDVNFGISVFHAKDDIHSLRTAPDFRNVFPMENLVASATLQVKPASWLGFDAEYAASALTRDIRSQFAGDAAGQRTSWLTALIAHNTSTSLYHAGKAGVSVTMFKTMLRLGYEHIDPDYATLGAYYFTNDIENYTLSLSRSFIKNKLNIALTGGMQHDDLNHTKARTTERWVGSANISYQAGERLSFAGSYSTFQSHSNMKSQFDYINQVTPYDNVDTLNYLQISRNANISMNWTTRKTERQVQVLNANLCWQDAADKQGGVIRAGGASTLINASLGYCIQYPKKGLNLVTGMNGTYNTVGFDDMYMAGPMAGISKLFKQPKIKTGLTLAYNTAFTQATTQSSVWNIRGQASYTLQKKHQFSVNLAEQLRQISNTSGNISGSNVARHLMTLSFNYAYAL